MRMLVAAAAALVLAQGSASIAPEEAAKHVGETVTVEGIVTHVKVSHDRTLFLDFGPLYPDQVFTAVILPSKRARFEGAEKLAGARVLVHGTVQLHKGKPEIVLEEAPQLRVVS